MKFAEWLELLKKSCDRIQWFVGDLGTIRGVTTAGCEVCPLTGVDFLQPDGGKEAIDPQAILWEDERRIPLDPQDFLVCQPSLEDVDSADVAVAADGPTFAEVMSYEYGAWEEEKHRPIRNQLLEALGLEEVR